MSRYRGPKLRITRRLGLLPGFTQKQSKKKIRRVKKPKIIMKMVKKQLNIE